MTTEELKSELEKMEEIIFQLKKEFEEKTGFTLNEDSVLLYSDGVTVRCSYYRPDGVQETVIPVANGEKG